MENDHSNIPIPNAIVITLPDEHRAAAARLRHLGDPAMAEFAQAHERVARDIQARIDCEAPSLAPE
jgi:hypothetical protein